MQPEYDFSRKNMLVYNFMCRSCTKNKGEMECYKMVADEEPLVNFVEVYKLKHTFLSCTAWKVREKIIEIPKDYTHKEMIKVRVIPILPDIINVICDAEYNYEISVTIITDYEVFKQFLGYNKDNIPFILHYDAHRNLTFVKGVCPRMNDIFVHIFKGDIREELPHVERI